MVKKSKIKFFLIFFSKINKMNKSNIISKSIHEILSSSTTHAIPNIVKADRVFFKLMWLFFLLVSFAGCCYFISKNLIDYLEFNPVTIIESHNEKESVFPAVSMCGTPSFNKSVKELIVSFEFNQDPNYPKNFAEYFEEFIDPRFNKCFRFNSGKNIRNNTYSFLKSKFPGRLYGLTIKLKLENQQSTSNETILRAINLFIHNNTDNPLTLNNKGFEIYPGTFNYFSVERLFYERLKLPYNDCVKDPKEFRLNQTVIDSFIRMNMTYSQKDCMPLCRNLVGKERSNCSCDSPFETYDIECIIKRLDQPSTKKCLNDFFKIYDESYQECFSYCPLECDNTAYAIVPFTQPILTNVTKDLKLDIVSFTIYYENLRYTLIKQKPKTEIDDFVANIGGLLGLFLGISFLSLVEIFEIIFAIIFVICEKPVKTAVITK